MAGRHDELLGVSLMLVAAAFIGFYGEYDMGGNVGSVDRSTGFICLRKAETPTTPRPVNQSD
jgi:hypothetical protein